MLSQKTSTGPRLQFPALTGIRALGAMAVFFVHLPFAFGYKLTIDVMAFFFVLSGFLITYIYYENTGINFTHLRRYFANRFARIYPVYFLLVTITIILLHDYRPVFLFKNYTITHSLFYNNRDIAIKPSWSITTEETFYFLAPLFLLLIRKFNYITSLLSATLLLAIALAFSLLPFTFLHTPLFVFSITFFGHFFEFFCGIFLALLILKKRREEISMTGKKYTLAGTAGIVIAMGSLVLTNNMNDQNRQAPYLLVNNFLLPLAVGLFFYGLIREKSRTARFLSSPLMQLLGRSSYSFYLVHMLIIDFIAKPFLQPWFKDAYNGYVVFVFLLTELVALLLFYFYEEPTNHYLRKRMAGSRHAVIRKFSSASKELQEQLSSQEL